MGFSFTCGRYEPVIRRKAKEWATHSRLHRWLQGIAARPRPARKAAAPNARGRALPVLAQLQRWHCCNGRRYGLARRPGRWFCRSCERPFLGAAGHFNGCQYRFCRGGIPAATEVPVWPHEVHHIRPLWRVEGHREGRRVCLHRHTNARQVGPVRGLHCSGHTIHSWAGAESQQGECIACQQVREMPATRHHRLRQGRAQRPGPSAATAVGRERWRCIGNGMGLARVGQTCDPGMAACQRQACLAHQLQPPVGGGHELGAAHSALGIDVKSLYALRAVAVQQSLRAEPFHHSGQLPYQVVRIVKARVEPSYSEDGHGVGGIAGKEDAAVAVSIQRHRSRAVERCPHRSPWQVALTYRVQMRLHELSDLLWLKHLRSVQARSQLVVNTPYVVGLPVHQNGSSTGPWRVKPCTALCRLVAGKFDVHDRIAPLVTDSLEFETEAGTDKALTDVACDDPIRLCLVVAKGILDTQLHPIAAWAALHHFACPANLDHPGGTRVGIVNGVEQVLLNVVLLQIYHLGVLFACSGGHVENQPLLHAVEAAPAGPRQALAQERRHSTQPLQYFKATPRNAGGPASFAHRVVRFHHHAANAPVRQAECGGQPYRASAYDKHLVTFGFVADLVKRWQGWLEAPVFEGSNFFKWHLRPAQIHRLAGRIVLAWQCENVIINQDMKTRNETDRASKAGS